MSIECCRLLDPLIQEREKESGVLTEERDFLSLFISSFNADFIFEVCQTCHDACRPLKLLRKMKPNTPATAINATRNELNTPLPFGAIINEVNPKFHSLTVENIMNALTPQLLTNPRDLRLR